MFRGPSQTFQLRDIVDRRVGVIDSNLDFDYVLKEIEQQQWTSVVWPASPGTWNVAKTAKFNQNDHRKFRDLAVLGFSIKADTPVQELFHRLRSYPEQVAVMVDPQGNPLGVIEIVSLMEKFWDQILQLEYYVSIILDTVNEAVGVVDQDYTVIGWNHGSEKMYRIPAKEIIGHHVKKFLPSPVITRVMSDTAGLKKEIRNDYNQPVPGIHVLINLSPIVYLDQMLGCVYSERDITDMVTLHNEFSKISSEFRLLKKEIALTNQADDAFSRICGHSKKLTATINLARRVANTDAPIVIRGESGTGKELFAEAIHNESNRGGKPFVVINCGAIPAALFESEMFGYQSGAFTGADRKGRQGKFELAHKGTIFLDEIGELPLDSQVKLLRVLQNNRFYRVGGDEPVEVDVRVIAATHRNLEKMIYDGLFREDLYYRINVVNIEVPPLRQRKEDIPELVYLFIKEFCQRQNCEMVQITPEVITTLLNYKWPGNIRELRNVVERMVILAESNIIQKDHLNAFMQFQRFEKLDLIDEESSLIDVKYHTEKEMIIQALESSGGDKAKAARRLGIPRTTLYYKLKKFDIDAV